MKEKTKQILEYADQGMTVPQIEEKTGAAKKSIYYLLRKYRGGVTSKVYEQTNEKDAVLIELRSKGLTYQEIEKITGRDAHNIRKRCVKLGIAYAPDEDHTGRKTERQFAEELKAKNLGFEYVSGYQNNHSEVVVMCTEKRHTFTWNASNLRTPYGMKCPKCQEERRAEKEAERAAAEVNRVSAAGLTRMLKLSQSEKAK